MEYISQILTIVFAVFLGLGFLLGFKRGLKRTVVRGIWITAIVIFLFIISFNITNLILEIDFGLKYQGQLCGTVKDYLVALLQHEIPVEGADYVALVNVLIGVIALVANAIVFLVCYWLLKFVTVFLYWIGNIFIFAGERRKKRRAKKEKQKYRIKKHRLLGGLVGAVLGFVSFCVTLTPIVGYVSLAKEVEGRTAVNADDGNGLLTEFAGDNYSKIINEYDSSIPIKVMNTLKIDGMLNSLFNNITSTKINDKKVVLADETLVFVDVYETIKDMQLPDLDTVSNYELNSFLDKSEALVDKVFDSNIVSASADTIIPFAAKYARQSINMSNYKPYVVNFYNAFFDQFEGMDALSTEDEVKNAIGLIRTLNNNNLLLPIIQDTTGDMGEFLKLNLTKPAADEIVDDLFALRTVNNMAPALVNFLLGYGSDQLGYEYTEENNVLAESLEEASRNMLYSVVDLLSTYDKDSSTKVDINNSTLGAFGSMLDEIKGLLSDSNFKSIVNSIEPDLEKIALESVSGAPQFLKNSVSKMVLNISEISGFEVSFTELYSAYETIKSEFDAANVNGNYNVDLMDFVKLGGALNTFQASDLLRDHLFLDTMKNAIEHYLHIAETSISGTFKFTFDEVMLENIEQLKINGVDWTIELPIYKHTAGLIANLLQDDPNLIVDKIKSDSDPTIEELGYELEHNLKTSALLINADRLLVADLLDIADIKAVSADDADLKENVSTLLADAKYNALNTPDMNWEREFKHIKSLAKIDFNDSSDPGIISIADTVDSIVFDSAELNKSTMFTQDMFNEFIAKYMDTMFGDIDETDKFYNTINRIKTSFRNETIVSYHNEIESLLTLKNIKNTVGEEGFEFKTGAVSVGQQMDSALAVGVGEDKVDTKVVVTKALINEYIVVEIDGFFEGYSDDLSTEIETIKAGFNDDVELYEVEFSALVRLIDVADTAKAADFDFANKTKATTLGANIDLALYPVSVMTVDYTSTIVNRDLINGYLKRVINDEVNLGEASEFKNVLGKITGTKVDEKTYNKDGRLDTFTNTYEKEFGYLSQLVAVSNNYTDITLDTINDNNPTLNATLAEQFDGKVGVVDDPLRNSQLVGDSLLEAIDSALNTYTTDNNDKFGEILTEVNNNYAGVKTDVLWASNLGGTTTYTQVITALTEIDAQLDSSLTADITDVSQVSTNATTYNSTLATLQDNILLSTNGTNRLAKYIMEKVLTKLQENSTLFTEAIAYTNNYIDYLNYTLDDANVQPYNSETIIMKYKNGTNWLDGSVGSTVIQVSKPFTVLGDLITVAQA